MIDEATLARLETVPSSMHCSVVELRELVRVYRHYQHARTTLTSLERREAVAFIDDELRAELEPRRSRLLGLVQTALVAAPESRRLGSNPDAPTTIKPTPPANPPPPHRY